MTGWALPDGVLREAPAYAPRPREQADLELLLTGALAPLTGFPTRADLSAIARTARLADGTPWPVRITLEAPASLVDGLDLTNPFQRVLVLTDPEGTPVAALDTVDVWPTGDDAGRAAMVGIGGTVRRIGASVHGTFRDLRRSPEQVREALPTGSRVLGVFVDRPLHRPQLAQIAHAARTIAGHVLVLVRVGEPGPDGLPPEALVRTVLAARDRLPNPTLVVVPLLRRGDEVADALLRSRVAGNYGATHLLASGTQLSGGGPRVLLPRELAYDGRDGQWRGLDDIPPRHRRLALPADQIDNLLDRGATLPEWHTPPAVAEELARARPPRAVRGVVVFLTGLPGSGKSTLARGVADELNETGERTVTVVDGDVARRFLTAGLGPSRADGDEAVRRIGFVAAEAARHGGLVLCCPVAAHATSRATARQLALAAGAGFILVYVSTPREVCEERDPRTVATRAWAAVAEPAGEDDSYEGPTDAQLVIDNSLLSVDESVKILVDHLADEGWLNRP
ncbi:MAG TPA: adenylyl-sulfate kinase [Micromonosporaceae bacterium]|jgi:sulfate adenylyltransferase